MLNRQLAIRSLVESKIEIIRWVLLRRIDQSSKSVYGRLFQSVGENYIGIANKSSNYFYPTDE